MERDAVDVVVVGAGPVGLACAIECTRRGLRACCIDQGCLCASIEAYPSHMTFFSTAARLEIGGMPFPSVQPKPSKHEALAYYREVARAHRVDLRLFRRVERIEGGPGDLRVVTSRGVVAARRVILATGFFQRPVPLGVPGEDDPRVSHYFVDGHRYHDQDLVIVGAANSAVIAALECWRMGARVTLVHRGGDFYPGVKYWLLPDIRNRIAEGEIAARFDTAVVAIEPEAVRLCRGGEESLLPADFVLAMTGYRAEHDWLRALGIELDEHHQPLVDAVFASASRPGIHVAGCALCGDDTGSIFIENGRHHAVTIAEHLAVELE